MAVSPFYNLQSEKSTGFNIFTYSVVLPTHRIVEKSNEVSIH